ncbi:MAG: SDR family oxidoreductase [Legionellales bacterium]|nr:SDR family oxidoreductase [Legionellales bacterium]
MAIDKLIIITGASGGIGAEVASLFSMQGYFVGVVSRQPKMLPNFDPERTMLITADVTDAKAFEQAVSQLETRFGSVDCLINNAGMVIPGAFDELTPEQNKQVIQLNVLGVMNGIHAVLPSMLQRNRGTIINISSLADRLPRPHLPVYAASKAAVKSLTESLRAAYAKQGIRFCNIAPAKVKTAMMQQISVPDSDLISPSEMAEIIVWMHQQPPHICIRDLVVAPTVYEL